MATEFESTVSPHERVVTLLGDILTTLGGTVSFGATVAPNERIISLLTSIQDSLAESGMPGGLLPRGVTGITFCFRPLGEPADAGDMSAYIVHGRHVSSFVRNTTYDDYAPGIGGPIYEIQLDRAYDPDEVAVFVWPGAFKDVGSNITTSENPTGAWSGQVPGPFGGIVHLPQVWQTGPGGDKSMRLVIPVTLNLEVGGAVTWRSGDTNPLAVMLVFFDRTATDYRDPPLP